MFCTAAGVSGVDTYMEIEILDLINIIFGFFNVSYFFFSIDFILWGVFRRTQTKFSLNGLQRGWFWGS